MNLRRFLPRLFSPHTASSQPPPRDLILGLSTSDNHSEPVILPEAARPAHLGIIGLTGVGKTYLLENLIRQDIVHGTGFALFDVHGDLADRVLAFLATCTAQVPDLADRVVLVEPFDPQNSIGFNPLEPAPGTSPHLQAQELAHVLRSRWEANTFGSRTEELLHHALYTLSANNLTILELSPLLTSRAFRRKLLATLADPIVLQYWRTRYDPLSPAMQRAVSDPVLTRVSTFLAHPHMRDILAQAKSTLSFRSAIGEGLWVIINLSKGNLGEENSHILGSLLFTKLTLDVMAQARLPEHDRRLFAVYGDELQNLVGPHIATLIAEARKYRVALTTGQQFWSQLPPYMRAAVLAMGSHLFFRLHYDDAYHLAPTLDPARRNFYTEQLTTLSHGNAYFRPGHHPPLFLRVLPHRPAFPTPHQLAHLRLRSNSRHTRPRHQIARELRSRYSLT